MLVEAGVCVLHTPPFLDRLSDDDAAEGHLFVDVLTNLVVFVSVAASVPSRPC
jgi:hypothetical protein